MRIHFFGVIKIRFGTPRDFPSSAARNQYLPSGNDDIPGRGPKSRTRPSLQNGRPNRMSGTDSHKIVRTMKDISSLTDKAFDGQKTD